MADLNLTRQTTIINVVSFHDIPEGAPVYLRPTTWRDYARVLLRLKIRLLLRMWRAESGMIAAEIPARTTRPIGVAVDEKTMLLSFGEVDDD